MSATFETIITGIRTTAVGELAGVLKHVEWTLRGTEQGQVFELPQKTLMGEPDAQNFIPLAALTPQVVTAWIEAAHENIPAIQAHIQLVLDRMVMESSMEAAALPWVTPETEPDPVV